jgi:hypothetical protein
MTELTGQQIETLRLGLQKGYPQAARFQMFLREQLDKRLTDYAANVPLPRAIFDVIEGAEAEGWVKPLVAAAYRTRKNQREIEQIAVELGVALFGSEVTNERPLGRAKALPPLRELQDLINPGRPFLDAPQVWKLAVEYPARICKVEAVAKNGTGFLVGADLVLTAHHVMAPAINSGVRAEDVGCRFDFSAKRDGSPVSDGLVRRLKSNAWHVASSPPGAREGEGNASDPAQNELDFCLLRLETSVGTERFAGSSDAGVPTRGWFSLNEIQSVGQKGQQLFIWQHPQGAVLKLAIGDQVGVNGSGNRFSYNVNTRKGSSGAPIFNAAMELIGLCHQRLEFHPKPPV